MLRSDNFLELGYWVYIMELPNKQSQKIYKLMYKAMMDIINRQN